MISRLLNARIGRLRGTMPVTRVALGVLVLAVAVALVAPSIVSADHQITEVVVTSDPVAPGSAVSVSVTIEADGNVPPGQNEWGSTAWGFAPNELNDAANCEDKDPDVGAEVGEFTHDFAITAPDAPGEYELLLKISGSDDCGGGQGSGIARTGVIVTVVAIELSIEDVEVAEGDSGTTEAVFTVSLSVASSETVTVAFATADDSATTADSDYTGTSGTVTFEPDEVSKTITVVVNGDVIDESDETFVVDLSGATNAEIADNQGVGTILDDDSVEITIDDVEVAEGDSGTTEAVFTVTLSVASSVEVEVDFTTANGSATTADNDYETASGTLTFDPGVTEQTVTVLVVGDTTDESDEMYVVDLTNPLNATIDDAQGEGTITDDDTVTIAINDVAVVEGDSGTTNAVFTVSLSVASSVEVKVTFATADVSAVADGDYTATSGTLTFEPGDTSKTITVVIKGDVLEEPNETYFVNLSDPLNAVIGDGQGLGTIVNDDGVTISINNVAMIEGDSGTTLAIFTVTLSGVSSSTVTVNFATADGSATTADNDYNATSGKLTFNPDDLTKTIIVVINGDVLDESNETYFVNLSAPLNATIDDGQGLGTIIDDDDLVLITQELHGEHGPKVEICHIPPGNPDKAHMITVGAPAETAHLAHGDTLGPCS